MLYRFENPEPINLTPDIETPNTPGCTDENVYGRVYWSQGNIHIRYDGRGLWSKWAGAKLIETTRDREDARRWFG